MTLRTVSDENQVEEIIAEMVSSAEKSARLGGGEGVAGRIGMRVLPELIRAVVEEMDNNVQVKDLLAGLVVVLSNAPATVLASSNVKANEVVVAAVAEAFCREMAARIVGTVLAAVRGDPDAGKHVDRREIPTC